MTRRELRECLHDGRTTVIGLRDLSVRLAGEGDVGALRVLVNEAYRELAEMGLNFTGTYQDEELTRLRMRGKEVYLAYLGDELVGTVSLEVGRPPGEAPYLYVNQLAVAPPHKRRGIGRFLMGLAEQRAREQGVSRLRLDTAIPARHLVEFYQALGYRVVDEVRREGKTYRSYVMEKRIAP